MYIYCKVYIITSLMFNAKNRYTSRCIIYLKYADVHLLQGIYDNYITNVYS